jgi:outer membrane protein
MTSTPSFAAIVLLAASLQAFAQADGQPAAGPEATAPVDAGTERSADVDAGRPPLWTAGLFMVAGDHAAYPGSDRQVQSATVLPFVTWRGPVFRVEGGGAGLRGLRTPRFELDIGASASFGSDGKDTGARRDMPAIGTLVELGPSLRINLGELAEGGKRPPWRLDLPVRAVFDADRDFDHGGLSFEPRLSWRLPSWAGGSPSLYASALFGSRALNAMYYGVEPAYATPDRQAYDAKGGLVSSRLGASWSRTLLPHLRLGLHAGLESVRGAANEDSPLVRKSLSHTLALTLTWTALRSDAAGVE